MKKILIQLDTDPQPSVFDRVVAVDAGVDEVFSHGNVQPDQVMALVHGAIFTRGPGDLKNTALFIGGSNVTAAETLLEEAVKHLLPKYGLSVSILFDANGSNTTAAAAVHAARKHLDLKETQALVLGATGPVGQRVAQLLARAGATVRIGSRQVERAQAVCQKLAGKVAEGKFDPVSTDSMVELAGALHEQTLVISAGAAGVTLLPSDVWLHGPTLKVAIDLNAVPPPGIEAIEPGDKARLREGVICYGAIGVGGTKMKIHRQAVAKLFESNTQVMDAEEVYQLGFI